MSGMNQLTGNKPATLKVGIRNAESSASIAAGQPVVLVLNGTNDGFDVVLPSTSSAAKVFAFAYGVATKAMNAGDFGEGIVYGFVNSLMLMRQTRGNSTDVWASEDTLAIGQFLSINTAKNAFSTAVSTQKIVTNATTDTLAFQLTAPAYLAQTLASYASSASSTADSRTAITAAVKAFVRLM